MIDIDTVIENARAQYHYPPIRTALLPSEVDDLQARLADRLYGDPSLHALRMIADLGKVFDAEEAEPAIEALGRILVGTSLIAGCSRMAVAPIIALGREMTRDSGVSSELPLTPAGLLASAVMDWRRAVPRDSDLHLVRALGMVIAKAIDDCEIVYELKIDPIELFKISARETLDGKLVTAVAAPAVEPVAPPVDKAAQRALAWTELAKASGELLDQEAELRVAPDPGISVGVVYQLAEDGMGGEEQIPIPVYAPGADRTPRVLLDDAAPTGFQTVNAVPELVEPLMPARTLADIAPDLEGAMSYHIDSVVRDERSFARQYMQQPVPIDRGRPACGMCGHMMSPRADMPGAWHCKNCP